MAEVREERLRIAYSHLPTIVAASVPTAIVCGAVGWGRIPPSRLTAWLVAIFVVGLARLALHRLFSRRGHALSFAGWSTALTVVMTIAGGIFGGFVLLPPGGADVLVVATGAITTAGLVSGGGQTLVSAPATLAASIAAALVPLGLGIYLAEDPAIRPVALLIPLFLFTTAGVARQNWRALNEALALRFENLDIATRLAARNQVVEEARARADAAHRDKNRFLAAAAHDLRQPLQALTLLVEALAGEALGERGTQLLARAGDALRPLDALVEGLLELSRLEAGVVSVRVALVDLGALAERVESLFRTSAAAAGLELRVVCRSGLTIETDAAILERIIQNLVANAIRYTREGRVLVCFRRRGERVVVQVWDTGPGIPEHVREEIFHPFQRFAETGAGVGLGLSIAEGLTELLAGEMQVRSQVGHGSVFELGLPRHLDEASESEGSRTIVVVESEPLEREGIVLTLESLGYTVLSFGMAEQLAARCESPLGCEAVILGPCGAAPELAALAVELLEAANGAIPPTVRIGAGEPGPWEWVSDASPEALGAALRARIPGGERRDSTNV